MSKKVQLEGNFGGSREDVYPATMAEIVYTQDGKNLEEKMNETNAQLSAINDNKLNKTDILSMANIGQDIKEAMTGGSVAVVGVDAVGSENIRYNSVSQCHLNEDISKLLNFDNRNVIFDSINLENWINNDISFFIEKRKNISNFSVGKYYYYIKDTSTTSTPRMYVPIPCNYIGKIEKLSIYVTYKCYSDIECAIYNRTKGGAWGESKTSYLKNTNGKENTIVFDSPTLTNEIKSVCYMAKVPPTGYLEIGRIVAVVDSNINVNLDGFEKIDKNIVFRNEPQELLLPDGLTGVTWEKNENIFKTGTHYLKIEKPNKNLIGVGYWYDIPVEYRNKSKSGKLTITYKSFGDCNMKVFFNTGTNWLDINKYFVDVFLPSTSYSFSADGTSIEDLFESTVVVDIPEIYDDTTKIRIDFRGPQDFSLFALSDVKLYLGGYEEVYTSPKSTVFKTVSLDGSGDFSTIQEAVDFANETANNNTKVILKIKSGIYNEGMLNVLSDNIIIQGEGHEITVIRFDGTTHQENDSAKKHGMSVMSNAIINDLAIDVNDAKYALHNDASTGIGAKKDLCATFNRCRFVHRGNVDKRYYNPVGLGLFGGQINEFNNCIFEYTGASVRDGVFGIYFHNWNNQLDGCKLIMNSCSCYGCEICYISELGSDNVDVVEIMNTKTNIELGRVRLRAISGYYTPTVSAASEIPYNIVLTLVGEYIVDIDRESRPINYKYF